jgi:4'-phosphopantetheinyl transferase
MRWLARGEAALPAGTDWLAPAEIARAAAMRYAKRRTEYLLSRLAAKHAVAAVVGRSTEPAALAAIEVRNAPSGAPYVLVDGAPPGLAVSISDRAGWAVCLVGTGSHDVGCDLELVEPRSPGFVRDFLTEAEQRYVAARSPGDGRTPLSTPVDLSHDRHASERDSGLEPAIEVEDLYTIRVTTAGPLL